MTMIGKTYEAENDITSTVHVAVVSSQAPGSLVLHKGKFHKKSISIFALASLHGARIKVYAIFLLLKILRQISFRETSIEDRAASNHVHDQFRDR